MALSPSLPSPPVSVSPSPLVADDPLPTRINTATRKQHTELNRLLVHRLPLALPPHAYSPALYSQGIVTFADLFYLFESEWELLEQTLVAPSASVTDDHAAAVRAWLAQLRPSSLRRSARIEKDIQHLRQVAGPHIFRTARLDTRWVETMRQRMRDQPHVLVAFAWVFYMAIFSGGRWIRQQLALAGPTFWDASAKPADSEKSIPLELPGFSFFSFDGNADGADIKAAFKDRLYGAEALLTAAEKDDVTDVAVQVFDCCISLVHDLDRVVWRQMAQRWIPVALLAIATLALILRLAVNHFL